jgi:hypothetical protein
MSRLETDRVFAQATVSWVALLCRASKVCFHFVAGSPCGGEDGDFSPQLPLRHVVYQSHCVTRFPTNASDPYPPDDLIDT